MLTFRFETRARFNNFSYNQVFDLFKQKITQDNLTKKKTDLYRFASQSNR